MDQKREDRIRTRAYEVWIAEGCPDGYETQHWLQAEQDIAAAQNDAVPFDAAGAMIPKRNRANAADSKDRQPS